MRPVAGRSKPALHHAGDGVVVDLAGLTGITEYQPDECTFTALAGTPVAEIERRLAEHGQALPFEPPLAGSGATIGGTVASGLNGPGRYHHGGVRDFLIGAKFVDGEGRLIRGGGKVVKNAAGFYLHHLLLGSLGRLGIFVELTFKVFPVPRAQRTLRVTCAGLGDALATLDRVRRSTTDPDAVELTPEGQVIVRIAGARRRDRRARRGGRRGAGARSRDGRRAALDAVAGGRRRVVDGLARLHVAARRRWPRWR